MDGLVAPASRPRLVLPRRRLQAAGDDRLVAQIRCGDGPASRNAFEVLYDRHHRGVLAFCRHMLGSPEEAEDAVQHTFSAAYRALLRDDRKIALRAWLYAIARNRCLSMLAARREQVALDHVDGVLPATTGLAQEVEQRDDLRELLADVQRLPEDQRAALVLAELEALSHKEIADILGVPPSKVKALVFQARESLMIRRQARDTSCGEIREQLSVLRGGALRRRDRGDGDPRAAGVGRPPVPHRLEVSEERIGHVRRRRRVEVEGGPRLIPLDHHQYAAPQLAQRLHALGVLCPLALPGRVRARGGAGGEEVPQDRKESHAAPLSSGGRDHSRRPEDENGSNERAALALAVKPAGS
ncbi:MAG: RNA polymerase sigma factor, partial [Actinobacteria bacterium]|nr:RNA polymerase sigma factor [Actinomycetota bacterium]